MFLLILFLNEREHQSCQILDSWYVGIVSYSYKRSINFLSWTKLPRANCDWVNKFVSTDITPINPAFIKKIFCFYGLVLCLHFCHLYLFAFFFYPVCNMLDWIIIITIIIIIIIILIIIFIMIFKDNFVYWARFFLNKKKHKVQFS